MAEEKKFESSSVSGFPKKVIDDPNQPKHRKSAAYGVLANFSAVKGEMKKVNLYLDEAFESGVMTQFQYNEYKTLFFGNREKKKKPKKK